MIVGIIHGREAVIRLAIRGPGGREQEIEAVVDSGYTGFLTLPRSLITGLDLRWQTLGRGMLADGSVTAFDVYRAKVAWDGRARSVFVDELKQDYRRVARGSKRKQRLPQRIWMGYESAAKACDGEGCDAIARRAPLVFRKQATRPPHENNQNRSDGFATDERKPKFCYSDDCNGIQ